MPVSTSATAIAAPRQGNVAPLPLLEIVRCPRCLGRLDESGETVTCRDCQQAYPMTDGIPQLFVPNDWAEASST